MSKVPFILFFILGMAPTAQDRIEANKFSETGVRLAFRNASLTDKAPLKEDANECNGVAGNYDYLNSAGEKLEIRNIPENYLDRYEDGFTVAKKFQVENETAKNLANAAAGGAGTDIEPDGIDPTKNNGVNLLDFGYGDGESVYCEAQVACDNHSVIWPATGQPLGPNNERSYVFAGKGERKSIHPEDALREFEAGNVVILDKKQAFADTEAHLVSEEGQAWLTTPAGQEWAAGAEAQAYTFNNPGPKVVLVEEAPVSGFTTG